MGVHGLWRLLDSFGTVIQPDDLKGKRVAIDASIWISQFRARVAPGDDVEHKILEGFLARILKLLFYGIQPVFVFDGPASSSKSAEHYRRMRQREINAQALLKRRAKQILMAQVAAGAIDLAELKSAIQADAASRNDRAAEEVNGKDATGAHTCTMDDATEKNTSADTTAVQKEEMCSSPAADNEERAKADSTSADTPSPPHHNGKRRRRHPRLPHRRRRRRRLAPDVVSSRNTRHFLQDVEGLLEERSRHEVRVLHNALHTTSTSLFMGPRRAVEEEGDDGETGGNHLATTATAAAQSTTQPPRVFVVEDAAQVANDVVSVADSGEDEEDEDGEDGSTCSSDCRAVSSSDDSVMEADGVAVQAGTRRTSSSSLPGAALLHSGDLARFLTTLSQWTPPSWQPSTAEKKGTNVPVVSGEDAHECRPAPLPPPAASVNATASTAVSVASTSGEEVSGSDDDAEEEERAESESEDESETESTSDNEQEEEETDEEEEEEAGGAADRTWEPFSQRIDPALLLQRLTAPRGTPPKTARAGSRDRNDEGDFTPVKLGQTVRAAPPPAVVVVVHSSDEDEGSNSVAVLSVPRVDGGVAATDAGDTLRSATTTAAPPPPSARSSVAVVPFELLHIVELLDCCGVPYVLSPAEADAQCAFLARHGLVDAVFTEDSDVLVHGATTVLRGFFSQSKSVVAYRQAELAACGITKTVLVALASLLGCDYTDGVPGIGLVGALEALVVAWTAAENRPDLVDSPLAVLHVLQRWRSLVRQPPPSWHDVDDEMTVAQFALFAAAVSQWHMLEETTTFPETHAVEAFFVAEVDPDVTPFAWLPPDWQQIRIFAGALGALSSTWLVQRFELARKEWVKREAEAAAAHESGQHRLTEYGAGERVRAQWAYQKQPRRHAAVLSQLRAVQLLA